MQPKEESKLPDTNPARGWVYGDFLLQAPEKPPGWPNP